VTPSGPAIAASAENRLARTAWRSGVLGMGTVVVLSAVAAFAPGVLLGIARGAGLSGDLRIGPALVTLGACAAAMLAAELWLRRRSEGPLWVRSRQLAAGRRGAFAAECLLTYVLGGLALGVAAAGYWMAGEYGRAGGAAYYQPWFALLDAALRGYVWLAPPYIVLTRALQEAPEADRRGVTVLLLKLACARPGLPVLRGLLRLREPAARAVLRHDLFGSATDPGFGRFTAQDAIAIRGLLVKLFFVPLMTVFFVDQFFHLSHNFQFLGLALVTNPLSLLGSLDLYNIAFTLVFAVDVGLAWAGYVISSRWVKTAMVSVEPTLLGWAVALLCYPPFQQAFGNYFTVPPEKGFLSIPSPWAVGVFATLSVASYFIYMSATVVFGLRFSNLTHRGIVTTGPYAYIRHPAYAAKNLAWWTVMMPYVLYRVVAGGRLHDLVPLVGLAALTVLYYLRAITEERHLCADPEYVEYCKRVPYRFIPKVL